MGLVTAYILYYEAHSNVCVAKIIARIIFIPSSVPSFSFYRYIIFCFCTLCLSLPCSGWRSEHAHTWSPTAMFIHIVLVVINIVASSHSTPECRFYSSIGCRFRVCINLRSLHVYRWPFGIECWYDQLGHCLCNRVIDTLLVRCLSKLVNCHHNSWLIHLDISDHGWPRICWPFNADGNDNRLFTQSI